MAAVAVQDEEDNVEDTDPNAFAAPAPVPLPPAKAKVRLSRGPPMVPPKVPQREESIGWQKRYSAYVHVRMVTYTVLLCCHGMRVFEAMYFAMITIFVNAP